MGNTWDKVKGLLAKTAPILGNAIAPGVGGIAGTLLSGALGVENEPDKIATALANATPEQIVAIKQAELENKTELARIAASREIAEITAGTTRIGEVNTSLRAETSKGGWSGFWRPFWGVISAVAFIVQVVYTMYLVHKAVALMSKAETLSQAQAIITAIGAVTMSLMPMWGVPLTVLGVAAWHRGQMQRVQAGETKGAGILNAVATRLASKVGR